MSDEMIDIATLDRDLLEIRLRSEESASRRGRKISRRLTQSEGMALSGLAKLIPIKRYLYVLVRYSFGGEMSLYMRSNSYDKVEHRARCLCLPSSSEDKILMIDVKKLEVVWQRRGPNASPDHECSYGG